MALGNYGRDVRYMVLGPLRVISDNEELPLGGPQQRLVLAQLLLARGSAVSTGALIEGVWGDEQPATAKKTLQGYIHHLRSQVGDALRTEGGGYSLHTSGSVDAHEFERLHSEAREMADGDPGRAASMLRVALELWSGMPYADLEGAHVLEPEMARLADLRIAALADRVDADLACGRHDGLIGELEGLTIEYPLHERFRAQHMLALHRAGRQVEALRAYEKTRRYLADELGISPSAELLQLERQILSGDQGLLLDDVAEHSEDRGAVRGYELREVVFTGPSTERYRAYQRSVGREVTIDVLLEEISDDPVFIAHYLADAQRVAALEHPNIGFVHDTWREPGRAFLVSRWFAGGSLRDHDARGVAGLATTMSIIEQVGAALAYAHRNGVAHGDLRAENVMLDADGNAHLVRFVIGSGTDPDFGSDRRELASLLHLLLTGRPPRITHDGLNADLAGADLPSSVEAVFDVAYEPGGGYGRVEDFLRAVRQSLGLDSGGPSRPETPTQAVRNPYKGLRAFQEGDAHDFYGRDDLVDRLKERLQTNRLVAVVGPSGSGKSSVVKAGLGARIRGSDGDAVLLQSEMFPGAFPFEELEGALTRVGVKRGGLLDDLLADERGLLRVLKQILPSDESELLLVVDQFEELFSMVADRQVADLFLRSLATALDDPRSRLRVVVTMRADFFDRPLEIPEFAPLMEAGLVPVSLPDRDGLAAAVAQPALSVGLDFEDGLIDRIVRDVEGQSGALPLLQYAMTELVDQRTSQTLSFATYEAIGGVYGALGKRAEDLYGSLNATGKEALRQAFLRMVSVDGGADDLRRRVTQSELLATGVDNSATTDALQLFGTHRLLTFDLDPVSRARTVEVAHEALTREWQRLGEWIHNQRDDLAIRRRLEAARLEWQHAGEDESYLPAGSRLAQFDEWAHSTNLSLTTPERSFLEAARVQADAAERRSAQRRRNLVVGLAAAAVVFASLAVVAFVQRRSADDAAFAAETGRLAGTAVSVAETNPRLALILAREAFEREASVETLSALQRVMLKADPIVGFIGDSGHEYLDVAWSDAGEHLVVLHRTGLEVYDGATRELQSDIVLTPHTERWYRDLAAAPFVSFDVSGDGKWAAVGVDGQRLALVDLTTSSIEHLELESQISALAFNHGSTAIAVGTVDGGITVRTTDTLAEEFHIDAHPEGFRDFDSRFVQSFVDLDTLDFWPEFWARPLSALAFTPDDKEIVSAESPIVRRWDATTGGFIDEFIALHEVYGAEYPLPLSVESIAFTGDAPFTVTLAHRESLVDFELSSGVRLKEVLIPTDRQNNNTGFTDVEVLGNGDAVVTMSDGRTRVLDELGQAGLTVRSVFPWPGGTAVSPDERLLAATGRGGVMVMSLDGGTPLASTGPLPEETNALAITANGGRILAQAGAETSVLTWSSEGYLPVDKAELPVSYSSAMERSAFVEYLHSPAGRDFVVVTSLGPGAPPFGYRAYLYDLTGDARVEGHIAADGLAHTFSPDHSLFASSNTAAVVVMDVVEGEELVRLDDLGGINDSEKHLRSLSFSADGTELFATNRAGEWHRWDTTTWNVLPKPLEIDDVQIAGFSPDGRYLATVSSVGEITIRDPDTLEALFVLTGASPPEVIGPTLYWAPDGSRLLSLFDQVGRLWDIESRALIGDPFPNDFAVFPAGVLRENPTMASASDGTLRVWNLDTAAWPDIACRAAGRNMTRTEWEQFGPSDTAYRETCPGFSLES